MDPQTTAGNTCFPLQLRTLFQLDAVRTFCPTQSRSSTPSLAVGISAVSLRPILDYLSVRWPGATSRIQAADHREQSESPGLQAMLPKRDSSGSTRKNLPFQRR